jgi:hypothetical protein
MNATLCPAGDHGWSILENRPFEIDQGHGGFKPGRLSQFLPMKLERSKRIGCWPIAMLCNHQMADKFGPVGELPDRRFDLGQHISVFAERKPRSEGVFDGRYAQLT